MSDPPGKSGIEVRIDDAKTVAKVILHDDLNQTDVDASLLTQCVREHGVSIDASVERSLHEIAEQYLADPQPIERIVAEATPPEHGRDADLEWIERFDPTIDHSAADGDAEAQVDFYSQVSYVIVEADDHIAMLIPATEGEDGRDVLGGIIPAKPGKDIAVSIDSSVRVEDDGRLIADITGVLCLTNSSLAIVRLLEVKEYVDFTTGNIEFDGSVIVREGVRDRFIVKTTEDLTVNGLIEAATIIVGRNFTCRRGMAAKDRGQLLVIGNANVGYLNNVRGRILGDLAVRRELMDCELAIGGKLMCGQGALVGGHVIVTSECHLSAIGSGSGTTTTLVLGRVPFVSAQLHRLDAIQREYEADLKQRNEAHEELTASQANLNPADRERLTELAFEISDITSRIEACRQKRQELLTRARELFCVSLHVRKVIHPKVHLKIGTREFRFEDDVKGPLKIEWDGRRQILCRRRDSAPEPIHNIASEINIAAA